MISPFMVSLRTLEQEWPEDRKSSHSVVGYVEPASICDQDKGEFCGNCANYIPPDRCKSVTAVTRIGYCERYKEF
jgi:hypothetical protein